MLELLPLLAGVILAQASPGPNLMAVASISLGSGRKFGILTAAGVASGVLIWAVLFTFGIAAIFSIFPQIISAVKITGGCYLVFLAVKAGRSAKNSNQASLKPGHVKKTTYTAYLTGLLVVLTNPKAALMWVAISTFLASAGLTNLHFLLIGGFVCLSAMMIYSTYAVIFSSGLVVRSYGRISRYIDVTFAAIFGGLGVKFLFDGLRELRS